MPKLPKKYDSPLWNVELAIREKRSPETDALLNVIKRGVMTPMVMDYIAMINEGRKFIGDKPKSLEDNMSELKTVSDEAWRQVFKAEAAGEDGSCEGSPHPTNAVPIVTSARIPAIRLLVFMIIVRLRPLVY